MQLTLFDAAEIKPQPRQQYQIDERLREWAFVYTSSSKGNNSGIRFMMTVEDARIWCSSDISQGWLHGTHWLYCWTSIYNFVMCHWTNEKPVIDLRNHEDNGTWDERIASTGARKINFVEAAAILKPLGVEVLL